MKKICILIETDAIGFKESQHAMFEFDSYVENESNFVFYKTEINGFQQIRNIVASIHVSIPFVIKDVE